MAQIASVGRLRAIVVRELGGSRVIDVHVRHRCRLVGVLGRLELTLARGGRLCRGRGRPVSADLGHVVPTSMVNGLRLRLRTSRADGEPDPLLC